eukprot:jgi/Chrzof1/5948/Cz16g21180.t1
MGCHTTRAYYSHGLVHACNQRTVTLESLNSLALQEQSARKCLKRHRAHSPTDSSHGQTSEAEMTQTEEDATAESECIQQPQGDAVPASGQHGTPALHQSTSTLDPQPIGCTLGKFGAIRCWHECMQNIAFSPEVPISSLQHNQHQTTLRQRSAPETVDHDKVDSCLLLPEGWHFTSQGGELRSSVPKTGRGCCAAVLMWHKAATLMDGSKQPKDLLRLWKIGNALVRAVIVQVYRYMLLWGQRYGCLSCYYSTWLLFCPGDDRDTLYISDCILDCAEHTPEQPQPTALGAMAMMTYLALATAHLPVEPYCPEGLAEGLARRASSRPGRGPVSPVPQHMHGD